MPPVSPEFLALQEALAGEYSIDRELGRGGMGIVYLARDVQLDRDVAIKVLPSVLARDAGARQRFLLEARTAAGLSHPHIVPIHRVGEAGGAVFFVMSYVEGETLGERLRRAGPLPPAEVARIMREVAWALAYAHGRGIVHRDVKPDNIMLESGTGRALVTDFGIAHGGGLGAGIESGALMGTAHFMSPEQAASAPIDGRSDIYALGVVGYLALSGKLPFEMPNLPALLVRQATESAPTVASAAPGLPSALAQVVDRCLERDPSQRFADGESLAAALAPAPDVRPELPATLRAWLGARNSWLAFYGAGSGLAGILTTANLISWATGNGHAPVPAIAFLGTLALSPLVPIIGFHLNQARLQFRAGHTLAELRGALDVSRRERAEGEALAQEESEGLLRRLLRNGLYAAATWSAVTIWLANERQLGPGNSPVLILSPLLTTAIFAAASNALEVQLIPNAIRRPLRIGIRERLWDSRLGEWFARKLGAPERSRAIGANAFRATEVALGVAAGDLYAALPAAYREQLSELPAMVAALEGQAAEARAEVERLAALGAGDDMLAQRRQAAAGHLASSVAALEGIRLDLLRLHAGSSDLAPLTTLMDAAREAGAEMARLAAAQEELGRGQWRDAARRAPTPA